ncbi:MFS transporter [Cellulomonas fengjieae]|uniref:MFS transporter n=1 Tax=Cellulomonas fengjieae TaxID=2819978 RepID=A0ABS3SBY5_9CELL|nr:MFS transporter [Cellulomonas fengjieae]MBO3083263.1 MFS transporter [Cellulomonas fengjieae]QVI65386.1 MFS transporter [Cellulomonas fengjieae]
MREQAATREPLGRRFTAHLTATGLANLGDGIVQMGVPLYALTLTRSPSQIALLTAAAWLPWLVLGLAAGVVVDRRDRKYTQVVGLAARALLLGAAVWLVTTGQMTMVALTVIVLLYGVTDVFVDLAGSALVPDLVPRSRLEAANGRTLAAQQVMATFVGGPVAGAMLALGTGWVFGVPAGLGVLALLLIATRIPGSYRHAAAQKRSATSEIREGVGFLVHHPVLRPLLVASSVMNMASTGYFAVFVLWMVGPGSRVGLEPEHYPLLTAVLAVGAVVGSIAAEPLGRRIPEVRLLLGCWLIDALLMAVPVLVPTVPAIAVSMFFLGFLNTNGNVISQSMRQRMVAPGMLGRVGGASRTLGYGLMPLGALLGGLVAEQWGLAAVFLGATAVCVVAAGYPIAVVRQRMLAELELPAPAPAPSPASAY